MQSAVIGAGGTCSVLTWSNVSNITSHNHVLVKPSDFRENSELSDVVLKAIKLLREKSMSMIPESDIGLSIAYKSVEKYCNPAFNVNGILRPRSNLSQQRSQNVVIYATETQAESEVTIINPISRTTISESGESSKNKEPNASCRTGTVITCSAANPPGSNVSGKGSTHDQSNTVVYPPSEELMEDKENFGKRKRSPSNEKHSPANKRNVMSHRKRDSPLLAATEEMECGQDEVDKDVNFDPGHFSTQRESPLRNDANKKGNDGEFISPIGAPSSRKNVRVAPSPISPQKTDATLPGLCSTVPKSIPFEPYTLPSIIPSDVSTLESSDQIDDEQPTQPFEDSVVVKIEKSEPVIHRSTSPEKVKDRDESWLRKETVKKTSEGGKDREQFGRVPRFQEKVQPAAVTEERTRNEDNDEFALPVSSTGRRRGRCRLDEEPQDNQPKRIKTEDVQQPRPATTKPETIPIDKKCFSDIQNPANDSKHELIKNKENMQSFLSKSTIVKQEKHSDVITELGVTFEKSLVVVQFVSLIKALTPPSEVETSSNGLPNYKKFKKVLHGAARSQDVHILPRIIGGKDLACDTNKNSRMDSFFATQPELQEEMEQRERENVAAENDNFDSAFTLPISNTRQKKRGRI